MRSIVFQMANPTILSQRYKLFLINKQNNEKKYYFLQKLALRTGKRTATTAHLSMVVCIVKKRRNRLMMHRELSKTELLKTT